MPSRSFIAFIGKLFKKTLDLFPYFCYYLNMKLILLVGPPGSGKSTLSKEYADKGYVYVNQDKQGKEHLHTFDMAIMEGKDVIVDRMNFSLGQRRRYLEVAKSNGYETEIIVLHQPYKVCLERIRARVGHETIKDEKACRGALGTFFTKYERVQDSEADKVTRVWPEGIKDRAVICDLDGTLCNIDHRLHFVKVDKAAGQKTDWKNFFFNLRDDTPNQWCADIIDKFSTSAQIVYCSGRPDDHRRDTQRWLEDNNVDFHGSHLYMRHRGDHREDSIIKEILLDFEILTRFIPYFAIDDRARVVAMWRSRGIVTLACAEGNF